MIYSAFERTLKNGFDYKEKLNIFTGLKNGRVDDLYKTILNIEKFENYPFIINFEYIKQNWFIIYNRYHSLLKYLDSIRYLNYFGNILVNECEFMNS